MSRNINFLRYDVEANCHEFKRLMAGEGYDALIVCTTRTDAEQLKTFNAGHSNARTPSFHAEHAGLAFDACKNVAGHEYDDPAFFAAAGRIGKAMGFTWGGDWTGLVDKPHFQWDNHGEYTGTMIRAKKYPPPMPLFKGAVPTPEKSNKQTATLRLGNKGDEVKTLQALLNKLGFSVGAVDGDFGAKTDTAVKALQKSRGLVADGIVGKMTWAALDQTIDYDLSKGLLINLKPTDIKKIEYVHGLQPTERIDAAYKRIGCDIITNANFFGMSGGIQTGHLADEGKILSEGFLSKWGFEFLGKTKAVFTHWNKRTGADFLGGYPCLVRDGKLAIDTTEAGFSAASTASKYKRGRTAIGIKADGAFVIRAVHDNDSANKITVPTLAQHMISLGCVDAVNLDGGGSSSWITPWGRYVATRPLDGFLAIWLN